MSFRTAFREKEATTLYEARPLMVYWELTRACDLVCRHCRAEAIRWRHPLELSTLEGYALLQRLTAFGEPLPHLVLTGGDPLKRPDIYDLIAYACKVELKVAVTPSGTYALTEEIVGRLKEAGVWMLSLSLDGSTAERHDAIRGVPGSFAQTVQAALWAKAAGLPFQLNTLVCAETREDIVRIYALAAAVGAAQWCLFFLVPVGRGKVLQEVAPEQSEEVMRWVYAMAKSAPFRIRTTEAPHYRRVALQQEDGEGSSGRPASDIRNGRQGFGVRDGNGVMFISHIGEIYPAGFLPLAVGNVRSNDPVSAYREASLFRALRDTEQFLGKCGACEYREICGGSRARAYAHTGDPLQSDPLCPYQPARQTVPVTERAAS